MMDFLIDSGISSVSNTGVKVCSDCGQLIDAFVFIFSCSLDFAQEKNLDSEQTLLFVQKIMEIYKNFQGDQRNN